MWFWSANFEEARVTYDSEDSGDLSLMPQETEKHKQKIFLNQSNVDSRCNGGKGKGMKGGLKEGTQKQKVRKVHFDALMNIRHIQRYEYIPVNVSENNLKCGNC